MKKHKIQNIIKKRGNNYQIVFNDGKTVFWPKEDLHGLGVGSNVWEHKHKNGQTVAFSWHRKMRFVVPQPMHINDAAVFLGKFKPFDRVLFNRAVVRALDIYVEPLIFPDNEKSALNVFLLGLQKTRNESR